VRILGISGSLRRDSHNTQLLDAARLVLPDDSELIAFEGLAAVPPYSADEPEGEDAHDAVTALRDAITRADAVLLATPEYNASLPGQLKNALDWASRPFETNVLRNKPAAVIGASTGMFGAVWAQADARRVLSTIGARVVDRELPVGRAAEAFLEDGELADPELRRELASILEELVTEVRGRPLAHA